MTTKVKGILSLWLGHSNKEIIDFMARLLFVPKESLMASFLWTDIVHIILGMSSKGITFFIGLVSWFISALAGNVRSAALQSGRRIESHLEKLFWFYSSATLNRTWFIALALCNLKFFRFIFVVASCCLRKTVDKNMNLLSDLISISLPLFLMGKFSSFAVIEQ